VGFFINDGEERHGLESMHSFIGEKNMIKLIKSFYVLLFLALWTLIWLPTPSESQVVSAGTIDNLLQNHKLIMPKEVVDDFMQGKQKTSVIVLFHSPDNLELPNSFLLKKNEATENARTYNLKDLNIRSQVRRVYSEALDTISSSLDPGKVKITRRFSYILGLTAEVSAHGLQYLVNRPDVASVEKNRILYAHLAQGIPLMNATAPRAQYDGSGLSIAICDTGIDTSHPRLGNGGNPIFNSKVIGGYDTGDNDIDPRPHAANGDAHGTACAGIAAGNTGSIGDYIGGVAPGAKLYAVKISTGDTGGATTGAMIAGWEWCITHQHDDPDNPIMIISTSFGGSRYLSACDSASPSMTQAASDAKAAGMTLFVSSGNDGYCDATVWPSCITHVISVGAVYDADIGQNPPPGSVGCISPDSCTGFTTGCFCTSGNCYVDSSTAADQVTTYSNSSATLALFAPSNNAYTTDIVGAGGYNTSSGTSGDYATSFGGTSAACPYAAGAAAVLQHAARSKKGSYLTPDEVQQYLVTYGDDVTDSKPTPAITKPRVNLGAAVDAIPSVHLIVPPLLHPLILSD
jgi:subtilisin family serine protease